MRAGQTPISRTPVRGVLRRSPGVFEGRVLVGGPTGRTRAQKPLTPPEMLPAEFSTKKLPPLQWRPSGQRTSPVACGGEDDLSHDGPCTRAFAGPGSPPPRLRRSLCYPADLSGWSCCWSLGQ